MIERLGSDLSKKQVRASLNKLAKSYNSSPRWSGPEPDRDDAPAIAAAFAEAVAAYPASSIPAMAVAMLPVPRHLILTAFTDDYTGDHDDCAVVILVGAVGASLIWYDMTMPVGRQQR